MDALTPLALAETILRALLFLAAGGGLALALGRAPARVRAGIWAAALIGSLLVPAASRILPTWNLPLLRVPDGLAAQAAEAGTGRLSPVVEGTGLPLMGRAPEFLMPTGSRALVVPVVERESASAGFPWTTATLVVWMSGAALGLLWQLMGLLRLHTLLARAAAPRDPRFARALQRTMGIAGVGRRVRLAISDQVTTPVTWGVLRPVILLPRRAESWLQERIEVVLLHELVHIRRWHWPVRMTARSAAAAYWYNPCAWVALRRLNLEQELACDEEVVSLGSKPSTYASHLLEIARSGSPKLLLAGAALDLAQRQHLEGRIMAILNSESRMKHRVAVTIFTAVLMIALVPTIAAVNPWASDEKATATFSEKAADDQELEELVRELAAVEAKLAPYLEQFDGVEVEMAPLLAAIEDVEVDMEPLHAAIEEKLQPMLERIEEIDIDMEPIMVDVEDIEAQMEPFMEQIGDISLDMAPLISQIATLAGQLGGSDELAIEEMIEAIHEQLEPMHEHMEELHRNMEPLHIELEQIHEHLAPHQEILEKIHEEMQPFIEEMEQLHLDIQPQIEGLEEIHESMAPFHERMAELERELEPFHEEMERVGDAFEQKLTERVESLIESRLGKVTQAGAPFDEAAERIVDMASVRIDEQGLRLDAEATEVREVLLDLFESQQLPGAGDDFGAAIDNATAAVSSFEVRID